MKRSDRVMSFVLVGVVIAGIWWGGAALRKKEQAAAQDAQPEAAPAVSATTSASASLDASPLDAMTDAAAESAGCRALHDASTKVLEAARKTRPCLPDPDASSLGCHTTSKATWGFRVDEVLDLGSPVGDKCGDTGYLVRLVHVDASTAEETTFTPALALKSGAQSYTMSTGVRSLRMSDAIFFDWDGDGDDEVFFRSALGAWDHDDRKEAGVYTFHASDAGGRIGPYVPANTLAIETVRDIDDDGRPDLLLSFATFAGEAPPIGLRLVAHSLSDGTFSLRDAAAIGWAQKQCPVDPKLDLSTQAPDDFGAKLADEMACALLWGHDKDLVAGLAKACPRSSAFPRLDAGECPDWPKRLVVTRPPISLR